MTGRPEAYAAHRGRAPDPSPARGDGTGGRWLPGPREGAQLYLAPMTVKGYRLAAAERLGASTTAHAALLFVRREAGTAR